MDDSLTVIGLQGSVLPFVGWPVDNESMEAELSNTFRGRIKQARKLRELTQEQVAEFVGLKTHMGVANWEIGYNYPSLDALVKAAELYAVSIDWLCWGGDVGGIDSKIRKVPAVLRPSLIDRLNREIAATMDAASKLPKEMLGDVVPDADKRLTEWSAKNALKVPKRRPSKTKRHQN